MSIKADISKTRDFLINGATRSDAHRERGIALLLTIFGLLLLTGITAAMLYSSNSETLISINYRDKQVASYAAFSALQEARNRIHPTAGDLAINNYLPTKTPDAGGYVLYILNPNVANGENAAAIAPWSPASAYYDQELCQEGMLGLARGQAGVACAAVFPAGGCTDVTAGGAGGGWCRYYDNSANGTPWNLGAAALSYKWVRISLKEDFNTPVYIPKAALASGKQACWDGNYQNQIPTGYNPNCTPVSGNSVIGISLISAGSGYTSAPTVTIVGGGGSGATATAQMGVSGGGTITTTSVTNGGAAYTSPPTVTFNGATDGSGATFKAVLNGTAITSVSLTNATGNYCYGTAPTINVTTVDPTDTLIPATVSPVMKNAGCISQVTPSGTCNNMKNKTAAIGSTDPPGGGSGFSGTAIFDSNGSMTGITISAVGTGYSGGSPQITINQSCKVTPTFTVGQQIQSVSLASGGNFMNTPTAQLSGSVSAPLSPTLPTLTTNWPGVNSPVTAIQILNPGTSYLQPSYPLRICSGGNCSAVATANTGAVSLVTALNLTSGGQNYTSSPSVTISGGGGSGASALATIGAGNNNTSMGPVYLLTSMAATQTGAKSMAQMEAGVRPPFNFNLGGPLTLGGPLGLTGPDPIFPNSNNFIINGDDANSCNQTATNKPAIGVYDSSSQLIVANSLGKPQNYIGVGGSPSVEDVYTQIGGSALTPSNLFSVLTSLEQYHTSPILPAVAGTTTTSLPATTLGSVTVVDGDLTLSGNPNGSGVLIVTGTMTFSGNFTWDGLVLVIGEGQVVHNGGGNGIVNGAMYVANIENTNGQPLNQPSLLGSLGSPLYTWNGGGGNSILYDHCKADSLIQKYVGQPSPLPLQVLSTRVLNF